MDNNRYSLLLKCGPKEMEVFNIIKQELNDATNEPDNRNEIVRRGLHSFRYLIEIDNYMLLTILSKNLKILYDTFTEDRFKFINNLALVIYASMISKKGIAESELFEPVVLNLQLIDNFIKNNAADENAQQKIRKILDHVTKSIDIIFLTKIDMGEKFKLLASYYEDEMKSNQEARSQNPIKLRILLDEFLNLLTFITIAKPYYMMRANITESAPEKIGETKRIPSSSETIKLKVPQ